jgi:ABC-type glycerol-3-phosphate transport system substrate-binding protein
LINSGAACQGVSKEAQKANQPVTIKYWRVWDSYDDFAEIINAYKAVHPNVNIDYRTFRYEEYEQALLEAFAEDRGPDIFSINNTWVNKYRTKILPAPDTVNLPYQSKVKRLGIKEETIIEMKTSRVITPAQVKNSFIDVVYNDVVWPDADDKDKLKVYALPLSADTLALYYNRDLLNSASIPEPAQNWLEFQNQVKKIVKQDKQGNIIQIGAALGTGSNVARSFDILSVLMIQNGAQMTRNGTVTLASIPPGMEDREAPPAEDALVFYTDFAYPAKEVYTWNEEMPNSLDAFISNELAYFFGYAYHLKEIKNRAPKLNFGYAKLPQIEGNQERNYANYWVEAVSKKTANANWAWDFLQFATSADRVKTYLDKTGRPTALRSLIPYQSEKEELLPFVSQLLTATSWYHGKDANAAETIFQEMIKSVNKAELTPKEALNMAAGRLSQTM